MTLFTITRRGAELCDPDAAYAGPRCGGSGELVESITPRLDPRDPAHETREYVCHGCPDCEPLWPDARVQKDGLDNLAGPASMESDGAGGEPDHGVRGSSPRPLGTTSDSGIEPELRFGDDDRWEVDDDPDNVAVQDDHRESPSVQKDGGS